MSAASIVVLLMAQASAPLAQTVAIVDGAAVHLGSIRCGPGLRNDAGACMRAQQRRLDVRIAQAWLDAAARLNGVTLTAEDERQIRDAAEREKPRAEQEAARYRDIVSAVLRIRKGESESGVIAEVERPSVSATDIRQMEEILPTVESAERARAKDMAAEIERLAGDRERRDLLAEKIRQLLLRKSAAVHQTFDRVQSEFWSGIAKKTNTRILDAAYRLPDFNEILRMQ